MTQIAYFQKDFYPTNAEVMANTAYNIGTKSEVFGVSPSEFVCYVSKATGSYAQDFGLTLQTGNNDDIYAHATVNNGPHVFIQGFICY